MDDHRSDPAVRAVIGLVRDVHGHHLSEATAVERVRDRSWELTEDQARYLVRVGIGHTRSTQASGGYLLARLVLEAADVRWGRSRQSPWWWAADQLVESARLLLVAEPDGARLRLACAIADEQIRTLRADRELDELAETMYAAGILRLHPFMGVARAGLPPEELLARQLARAERRAPFGRGAEPDGKPGGMPHPRDAALEALPYLYGAVALSEGHLRGRCLTGLGEGLALLSRTAGDAPWIDDEVLRVAREAAALLDPALDPYNRIRLLRMVAAADRSPVPRTVHEVLGLPVADLVRLSGSREAGAVVDQALCLFREAGNSEALRALVAEAYADLPDLDDPERRLELWESQVHVLPGCDHPCPADQAGADLLYSTALDDPDPSARSAAALHLAAHLYHRDGSARTAWQLLRRAAADSSPGSPDRSDRERDVAAVLHLRAAVASRAAPENAEAGEPDEALRMHGHAAVGYASLGLSDLAVQQLGHLVARATTPDTIVLAAVILRESLVPVLSADPRADVSFALYRACQLLVAALGTGRSYPVALLALMTAAKGLDFGTALAAHRGPRPIGSGLPELLGEIARREREVAAPESPRLAELGEDLHMLSYAGAQETGDGQDDRAYLDNLRRAFDREFSRRLYGAPPALAGPGDPADTDLDGLCRALSADTVLLSLFMGVTPQAAAPATSAPSDGTEGAEDAAGSEGSEESTAALYLVTMTREGVVEARVVPTAGLPSALLRLGKDGYSHTLHPFALDVQEVRSAVLDDPLHRPVTRAGEERLALENNLGAGLAGTLDRLHDEGYRHLCVWAHGPFHYLPFHLLHVDGRPLADRWTVTAAPSPACLTAPAPHSHGSGLLALGAAHGGAAWGLPPEPELDEHVRAVAGQAGGTALTGADATARALLERAPGHRYLHLAAHGSHSPVAPWFQCLYLNPPQDGADGRLFAHEVVSADLRGVELVTLSACESALGRFDLGDGLRGLPAAFLLAGARAVVGCLWPVRTETATSFFAALYRALAAGRGPLEAFRLAQTETRAHHPQYRDWGAFTYSGSWGRYDEGTD
ncbi:CHAT domain-containing protein [Kitasatospora sp. NPDC058170]|uniref:CHAT domain-containing protein n=1 Tax=Kitasatospora sp. NPDC058170 TaxID=3346364 RepID=UPI0036DA3B1D